MPETSTTCGCGSNCTSICGNSCSGSTSAKAVAKVTRVNIPTVTKITINANPDTSSSFISPTNINGGK